MAAPFFNTPFQLYVYQSPDDAVIPFQILGGEAQIVQPENEAGVLQWFFGKNISSLVVQNAGQNDGFVEVAAPSLARIIPLDLAILGGDILCQPDAFLCSVIDVKVSNAVDQRIRNIPDGVEVRLRNIPGVQGFLGQKLSGRGLAFIVAGDSAVQKIMEVGKVLAVDVTCIAAVSSTVSVKIQYNAPTRRAVFLGEHQVMAIL